MLKESSEMVTSISVITVCYNSETSVETTINSVLKQKFRNIEHIFIDGGSTDGTLDVIKSYDPSHLISEPDDGIYYAMQKGADIANGDILFFLNCGDTFFDDTVVTDVIHFFNKSGSDAIFGNLMPYYLSDNDKHDHMAFQPRKLLDLSYFNNRRLFFDESIHHQTIFYKRKIFKHCNYICEFPKANGEYFLNMCAFIKHGFTLKHYPRTICQFALGGKSTSNFAREWEEFSIAREYLRKKFFPIGPNIPIPKEDEYLFFPPSLKNRVKIFSRKIHLYFVLSWIKHAIITLCKNR